jgi:hypothetical protein
LPENIPEKVQKQIEKAGLPQDGEVPFEPKLTTNRRGDRVAEKAEVQHGPKQGKKGYVDSSARIWIRDRGHADLPDHWDVQIDEGLDYIRVDDAGNVI